MANLQFSEATGNHKRQRAPKRPTTITRDKVDKNACEPFYTEVHSDSRTCVSEYRRGHRLALQRFRFYLAYTNCRSPCAVECWRWRRHPHRTASAWRE